MGVGENLTKLVIFDLDGTIFHLDIDWDDVEAHRNDDAATANEIEQYVRTAELDGVESGTPVEGAKDVLDALARNHSIAIASRNFHTTIEATLKKIGIECEVFIVGQDDVTNQKPDPEGLQSILSHFAVDPSESTMVGDTYHDIEAAHAHNMTAIVIRNPKNAYIPEGADRYIDTLNELLESNS